MRRNDQGQDLGDSPVLLTNTSYGTGKYNGFQPEVAWPKPIEGKRDERGFDISNGNTITHIQLPKGTHIIRYGPTSGSYTAPEGSLYSQLGLPYVRETCEYHVLEVIADSITVFCIVDKGKVASIFDSPGGGIQYKHPKSLNQLMNCGDDSVLKEIVQ